MSDRFGPVASTYAQLRPTYPDAFWDAYVSRLGRSPLVWDCGCGTGQAARALAARGVEVIATDVSAGQLAAAAPHRQIRYRQAAAESSGLEAGSVDGVLVAQAVHWFAIEAFNAEVRRVARPGALIAWIGYLPCRLSGAGTGPLQQPLDRFHSITLAPWWPAERRWVEQGYAGLPFPGSEWPFPQDLVIERRWDLNQLLGYLSTWSAVQGARACQADPLPALRQELEPLWPQGGGAALRIRWPFMGRWGQLP